MGKDSQINNVGGKLSIFIAHIATGNTLHQGFIGTFYDGPKMPFWILT